MGTFPISDRRFGLWLLAFRLSLGSKAGQRGRDQIGTWQLKIGNVRGPLQSNFARYAYEGDFRALFERGERYAGSETNHSEPYQ